MRRLFLFLLLFWTVRAFGQDAMLTITGRVVDAVTDEPLPYAAVYKQNGMGTLTNVDGDFRLTALPQDILTFSFVGFKKMSMQAWEVPSRIRLKPYEQALKEVEVRPVDKLSVLAAVIKKLKRDFSKHKKDRQAYFMRALMKNDRDSYLIESLMGWSSAVNLRDDETFSGIYGINAQGRMSHMGLTTTNISRMSEISPSAFQSAYWQKMIKPLYSLSMAKKYYNISVETLVGDEGEKLYRFSFRWKGLKKKILEGRRHMTGEAFVDAKTMRLLRFEGEVGNAFQRVNGRRMPTSIKFHMNFDYTKGYAAVNNIAVQGGNDAMMYRYLLFDAHADDLAAASGGFVGGNIIDNLTYAKYDSTLWEKYDIVRRTREEELIAFGETTQPPLDVAEEEEEGEEEIQEEEEETEKDIHFTAPFTPLMERLIAFGKSIPQEKVYVHMDNTCYFQGDTIWFTAYTRQTNTNKPSNVSGVLYVELLNNDGYLVERKLIEMKEGRGTGFFALNKMIQYSGFYELRAYTRWQLNWGEHEHEHPSYFGLMYRDKASEREFFRDYDKLYSRVFPVYDKPLAPGDYTRDMTLRVLRREFKNDPDKRSLKLSLFPEGGNLVAGLKNRVAFEAAMSDGEQVDGVLTIGNDSAKVIHRGRGVFSVIPQKGMERKVTFVASNGEKASAKLPEPEEKGAAIKVQQEGDSIIIETSLAGLNVDSLALTIMHEGKVEEFHEFSSRITIHHSQLKVGIHQATVFDVHGRVFADRLFFVRKAEKEEPTLAVSGMKDEYSPYEKVELKVKGKRRNVPVSLSIRDSYQSDPLFDSGNIMTEMLLSSEIKGFIPNPDWYFEKDDEEHRQALDLLMMTQGWRRFVWRDMAVKGEWDLTQPNEKTPILIGNVSFNPNRISAPPDYLELSLERSRDYKHILELARKKLTPGLRLHAEIVSLDSLNWETSEAPFNGDNFTIRCSKFYGNSMFFLSVADTTKWTKKTKKRYPWIQSAGYGEDFPLRIQKKLYVGEADFRAYISWPYPRFVLPYNFYQTHLPPKLAISDYDVPFELLADSAKVLREVRVKARRRSRLKGFDSTYPAFMLDAYDVWNTIEDAGIPFFAFGSIGKPLVRVYMNEYGVNEEGVRGEDGKSLDTRIRVYSGLTPTRRSLPQYASIPTDSIYHPKYLTVFAANADSISPGERKEFLGDESIYEDPRSRLDKYVVYTDYQPRLEGSNRYRGSNRPETRIAVYPFYDGSRRTVYRDRYYLLPGFSVPAEFYHPDYSQQTPPEPTDYHRTLYWNPNLQLDKRGEANVTFYNNSRSTILSIEAEGQATDGTLLWTK